ncbi:4Fe-4S binding protein [bacterium]|nr:4Fe-4S binding protein [bacterium]
MKKNKIVLRNKKSDLRKLVMLMNKQNSRSFPPFTSLLNTLDYVLADGEIDLLLRLGTDVYSYDQALAASGMKDEGFNAMFESLRQKGFIGTKYSETGEERYSLLPILVGWFEAQTSFLIGKPEEKEFARRYMEFFHSVRNFNFFPFRHLLNLRARRAPVSHQSVGIVEEYKDGKGKSIVHINQTIRVPDSKIYPTNTVNDLIQEYGSKSIIGQFTCMCRRVMSNLGEPCRLAMPDDGGCLGFGDMVRPYIQYGHARRISKEKAFEVIQKVRDKGAVHAVFHERDDTNLPQVAVCNCCWDCCGILRSYNTGLSPLRYSSFYSARIKDSAKCTGCKKCEKYCPTAAITVSDKKVSIDAAKCIGCGQCVHQCPHSAVELVENIRTAFLPMLKKSEARIKI